MAIMTWQATTVHGQVSPCVILAYPRREGCPRVWPRTTWNDDGVVRIARKEWEARLKELGHSGT